LDKNYFIIIGYVAIGVNLLNCTPGIRV